VCVRIGAMPVGCACGLCLWAVPVGGEAVLTWANGPPFCASPAMATRRNGTPAWWEAHTSSSTYFPWHPLPLRRRMLVVTTWLGPRRPAANTHTFKYILNAHRILTHSSVGTDNYKYVSHSNRLLLFRKLAMLMRWNKEDLVLGRAASTVLPN